MVLSVFCQSTTVPEDYSAHFQKKSAKFKWLIIADVSYYTYERVTHQSVFFQSFFTSVFHMQSVKEVHEISLLLNTCSMFLISYYSYLIAFHCQTHKSLPLLLPYLIWLATNLKRPFLDYLAVSPSFFSLSSSQCIPRLNCLLPHCHSSSIECTGLVSER